MKNICLSTNKRGIALSNIGLNNVGFVIKATNISITSCLFIMHYPEIDLICTS